MSDTTEYEYFIITNSTLDFVILGPRGDADAVLARSANASLELIGFASSGKRIYPDVSTGSPERPLLYSYLSRIMFINFLPMISVKSSTTPESIASDSRELIFTFAINGMFTLADHSTIEAKFDEVLKDVHISMMSWNKSRLEKSLAPLIYLCKTLDLRNRTRSKILKFSLVFYFFIALIAYVYIAAKFLINSKYFPS